MELEKILKNEEGQPAPAHPRYVVRDAAYALQPQLPLEWIIDRLITAGSVTVFYGEPGSKKTYSLLSLAVCTALGKPWLGFNTKSSNVLIIDEESGERRLTLRIGAAIRGELGDDSTQVKYVSLAGFRLDDTADQAEIEKLIIDTGAGLVIIDALADVMTGDENSKQDTQPVFTALRRIAERTNAAIIVIHHSNRAGNYRGSSAIKGAIDLLIKIESQEGSKYIDFKSEKSRDSEAVNWAAEAVWSIDQFYLNLAEKKTGDKPLSKSKKYVLRYLQENGPSLLSNIMSTADTCTEGAAKAAVYALVDLKLVKRTNPGAKGVDAIYDLVKEDEVVQK